MGSSKQQRYLQRAAGRCEAVNRVAELAPELPGGKLKYSGPACGR
ncbi:hypothetical protein Desku_0439 [Desulfofundulus kuznetsovii DSM 6115]|uniref:Uncharacterized protein n=1 Tax=Desulfofundulus kuznetsovii (strain DSM 6115 / VKM B-1805 / 17) TaxID=760568 RepID=A0AAU8PWH3_DESK7|nr:hypothetical protein Desku_0439 [Desulfofundulus kuznetsovii DSM 6115]